MKKIVSILIAMIIIIPMSFTVTADTPNITVTVDGNAVAFDAKPEMVNDRVMVPMRAIFEKLGAEVTWNQTTQTVTATTIDKVITTTIGSTVMTVNGEEKIMDVAPYIKEERTYVPARFVSEALSCDVQWAQDTYTVVISQFAESDMEGELEHMNYPAALPVPEVYDEAFEAMRAFSFKYGQYNSAGNAWEYSENVDGFDVTIAYSEERWSVYIWLTVPTELGDINYSLVLDGYQQRRIHMDLALSTGYSEFCVVYEGDKAELLYEVADGIGKESLYELCAKFTAKADEVIGMATVLYALEDFGIIS